VWDPLKLEVRWFYRLSDLDDRTRDIEKLNKVNKEEIFESGHVAVMDACLLLGKLILRPSMEGEINESQEMVPCAKNICNRFYLHQEQDLLHLFDGESIMTRGLEYSQLLNQNEKLRVRTYKNLNLPLPKKNDDSLGKSKDQNMLNLPPHSLHVNYKGGRGKAFYCSCYVTYPWSMLTHRDLICPLEQRRNFPKWQLCVGDVVAVSCDASQGPIEKNRIAGRDEWYPYSQPWSHGQVVAIYRTDVSKSDLVDEKDLTSVFASEVQVRIRWFDRISEALSEARCTNEEKKIEKLQKMSIDSSCMTEQIVEGKNLTEIACESILGPIRIDDHHSNTPRKKGYVQSCEDDSPVCIFMVQNKRHLEVPWQCKDTLLRRGLEVCDLFTSNNQRCIYHDKILVVRKKRMEEMSLSQPTTNQSIATKKVSSSPAAEDQNSMKEDQSLPQKRRLFDDNSSSISTRIRRWMSQEIEGSLAGQQQDQLPPSHEQTASPANEIAITESSDEIPRVLCQKAPFHIDVSSRRIFYTEIEVKPPLDSYDDTFLSRISTTHQNEPWIVKMGDTGKCSTTTV
jgi:hypothetical protein